MRLRRRVQLLALAFVALLGVNVAFAVRLTVVRDRTAENVEERLDPAEAEVAALLNAFISQETGQRGYIITGGTDQLAGYVNGRRAAARKKKSASDKCVDPRPTSPPGRLDQRAAGSRRVTKSG